MVDQEPFAGSALVEGAAGTGLGQLPDNHRRLLHRHPRCPLAAAFSPHGVWVREVCLAEDRSGEVRELRRQFFTLQAVPGCGDPGEYDTTAGRPAG